MGKLGLGAVTMAKGALHMDRLHDRAQISKYLAEFGLPFEITGVPVSFCMAGAGWYVTKEFANEHNVPFTADDSVQVFHGLLPIIAREVILLDPRCHIVIADAKRRGNWCKGLDGAVEGDLVFFCFNGTAVAEHVGFYLSHNQGQVQSCDFNTSNVNNANGGAVEDRSREVKFVVGHIPL